MGRRPRRLARAGQLRRLAAPGHFRAGLSVFTSVPP
jgi:hypothetical protein